MSTPPTPTADLLALEVDTSVASNNLNKNPSAVHGMARWTSADVEASAQGFDFGPGPTATTMTSDPFPIAPGQFVGATYSSRRYGSNGARRLTVTARFFNAADALIGSSVISQIILPTPSSADSPVVEVAPAGRQAPANSTSVRVEVTAGTAAAHRIYLRDVGIGVAATAGAAMVGVPAPVWTAVLGSGLRVETSTGVEVNGVDDELKAGALLAVITDPNLDPASSSVFRRGRAIRLRRAAGAAIWTGVVENADAEYRKDGTLAVTIVGTDAARDLDNATAPTLPGGTFTQQVAAACYAAGLGVRTPAGAYLDASTGIASREDNATAGTWLKRVVATHGGAVWIDPDGTPRAELAPSQVAVTTFSDNAPDAGLKYTQLRLAYGSRSLVNDLTVKRINEDEDEDGGKTYGPYTALDSERDYGRVSATVEVVGGSPSSIAARLLGLYARPRRFPAELTVNALDNLALVLTLKPYSAVRVKRTGLFDEVVRVLHVTHNITPMTWTTTFLLKPLETSDPVDVLTPTAGADTGPGDVAAAGFPRLARRSRSTTQNVPTGDSTVVLWNQELDAEGIPYDAATGRFTIPRAGRYIVSASLTFPPNSTGARVVDLRRNGSTFDRDRRVGWSSTDNIVKAGGHAVRCAAGDTIDVVALHNAGTTLALQTATVSTWVAVLYVGP